jgi:hypothetical protein
VFGDGGPGSALRENTRTGNNTYRLKSVGSASSLIVNEKAKVLRDEISTLD